MDSIVTEYVKNLLTGLAVAAVVLGALHVWRKSRELSKRMDQ